jgi:RHS repeat-associated protein
MTVSGLGQRVSQVTAPGFIFVYDEMGHQIGKYDGTGRLLWETVWLGDLPVAVLESSGRYYIAPDHLGAPHLITNAAGQVVWQWNHDPFGNGAPTGSLAYELRFPGQFFDQKTGLHYNYFRDYDPRLGRYLESDPIGLAGGVNTYGYAGGNPLTHLDFFGLCPTDSSNQNYAQPPVTFNTPPAWLVTIDEYLLTFGIPDAPPKPADVPEYIENQTVNVISDNQQKNSGVPSYAPGAPGSLTEYLYSSHNNPAIFQGNPTDQENYIQKQLQIQQQLQK